MMRVHSASIYVPTLISQGIFLFLKGNWERNCFFYLIQVAKPRGSKQRQVLIPRQFNLFADVET